MGLSVGRLDWENIPKELSPYALQVLMAYESVEPFGERRADMRAAVQTITLIQSQRKEPLSEESVSKMLRSLTSYADPEFSEVREISPNEAARMCSTSGGGR